MTDTQGSRLTKLAGSSDRYPWIAMGVVLIGTFMVILDTTIVNVALPQIGMALERGDGIEWVVTVYLLAVGVAQLPAGWLADRYGRKRVFVVSLALFGLGSLLAGLSPTLELLVASRVIQGLGGGALIPIGMAMIYELFPPHRRGTALGIWGVAAMAAPAFGPVIGGYLVTSVDWHWLFLINVPIGLAATLAATRLLRDTGYRERRPFDGVGLGLATTGLVLLLLALARASDWGWASASTIGLLVLGLGTLAMFAAWERRVAHPAIDVRIFTVPIFSLTLVVIAAAIVVQYAILFFLPLSLQVVRGLTALEVGIMLVPMAIGGAISFPIAGRITDRIGPRLPVVVGLLLLAASAWILGHLAVDSPILVIEVAVFLQGLGFGFSMMPNSVTALNALPRRFVAQATSVRQLNVRVAASFGVAVLASVVATISGGVSTSGTDAPAALALQHGYNTAFVIASVIALAGATLALLLPGRHRNDRLLAERSEEHDRAMALEAG